MLLVLQGKDSDCTIPSWANLLAGCSRCPRPAGRQEWKERRILMAERRTSGLERKKKTYT